ncbi:hypothetical protein FACS189428_7350 [Clostridia bacterium]|nr:hypothetical protein FACS189428_7350 [Clostridia bacterium]
MFFLVLTLMVLGAASMNAQVTIGSDKDPESFAVLELINSDTQGLRLPQLTGTQRTTLTTQLNALSEDKKESAKGLTIFNTTENCIETWNGVSWISACAGPITSAMIAGPVSGWPSFYMFTYQTITLTANAGGGSAPTSYQWYRNGVPISGANSRTYVFDPSETANEQDDYTFYCFISNEYSTNVQSNNLLIMVEKATKNELKGIVLKTRSGGTLTVAAQFLGQETSDDGGYTGDLYQYGRGKDGHEKQNSEVINTQATNDYPPYAPAEVQGKFIAFTPWTSANLFNSWPVGTDPCPAPWHMPTKAEWQSITPHPSLLPTTSVTWEPDSKRFLWTDGSSALYFPPNAMRLPERVAIQSAPGLQGSYFSRTWASDAVGKLTVNFDGEHTSLDVGPMDNGNVRGYRVRCVK